MAVRDGMDVINLSLGEPEIEPSRDLVVRALEGAAAAGVVPVVAAGNDYGEFGGGSITSPGTAPRAITVAAVTADRQPLLAEFSSAGPTPVSLQLKPDVSAPGVDILSSVPSREGSWAGFSGTSMAAPHVAGAAALLRQRHRAWTVAQIKSALMQTRHARRESERRPSRARGRRSRRPAEGGRAARLRLALEPLVRAASPRGHGDPHDHARRRGRRRHAVGCEHRARPRRRWRLDRRASRRHGARHAPGHGRRAARRAPARADRVRRAHTRRRAQTNPLLAARLGPVARAQAPRDRSVGPVCTGRRREARPRGFGTTATPRMSPSRG